MTLVLPLDAAPAKTQRKPAAAPRAKHRQRHSWRYILAVLIVLGVGGTGTYAWTQQQHQAATPVSTVTVAKGSVQTTVLATGTLEASNLVSVGAQTSGVVKAVNYALGDNVKAGDVVAEIDSLNQENALKSAQAALDNVTAQKTAEEANLAKYQKALGRAKQLGAGQLISQTDYDTAEANVEASEAQLKSLDAQIEQANLNVASAQLNLDRTKITAPIDGTVVAVLVDQGQTVNAAQTAPTVMKIANLDTMEIKAEISEADVAKVKPGQQVTFTTLGDATHPITATLKSVEPAPASIASDDTTTSSTTTAIYYDGIFEVPNPDHSLRISMTAKVTIVLDQAQDVATIPASALGAAQPDGSYKVSVLDAAGQTETRVVAVGLNNKVTAEIKSGLQVGDKVVAKSGSSSMATASKNAAPTGGPMGPMGGL